MKNVLYGYITVNLPNLNGTSGNGVVNIPEELYYEYMFKLNELIKLAEKVKKTANDQGIYSG